MNLTHGALFNGIGGFSLAARNQGISTIWECEINDYCNRLSQKNFPEIKTRYRDIKDMTNEKNKIESVSIISGGFPCQPFSTAGKQRGQNDNRYLWPQTIEVIKHVRPDWIILENVPGIINMELGNVLNDVESADYQLPVDQQGRKIVFVVPALAVGANHIRHRVWIMAHSMQCGNRNTKKKRQLEEISGNRFGHSSDLANAENTNRRRPNREKNEGRWNQEIGGQGEPIGRSQHWEVEPPVGRVANGIPRRVDRLKGLGNAIVPQIAEIFFSFIKSIEGG